MKNLRRIFAVVTLGVFLGLAITESFHNHANGQTESHCPICQVAHQTPVIGSGPPRLHSEAGKFPQSRLHQRTRYPS